MTKILLHRIYLPIVILLMCSCAALANQLPREARIDEQLNAVECARSLFAWSDVCAVGSYHPRDAAVDEALSRAEASYSRTVPAPETASETPSAPMEFDAPTQPPRIPPHRLVAAPGPEPDRMAVVDEALESYERFQKQKGSFAAGVEMFTYKYEEEMFMEESGTMYGVFVDYRHRFKPNNPVTSLLAFNDNNLNIFMFDARFSAMKDGHYQASTVTLETFDNKYFSHELRMMGGYELPIVERRLIVMPYAGLGFRYLLDDGGGKVTVVGEDSYYSYDRESYYFYIPLGIEARKFYNQGWSTKLTAEYDWLISGRQKSHLPIWDGGTAENFQPSGYGIRGSFRLAKEIEAMEFFVEPFARYWHIADSNVNDGGIEPRNTTQEYGAKLGVRF